MTERTLEVIADSDGFRLVSTDGVEYWDVDGPFGTEAEAQESLATHKRMWDQAKEGMPY